MIKSLSLCSAGCLLATMPWVRETANTQRIPFKGKVIFASNHSSLFDGVLVTAFLNWQRKAATHTIASKEPFEQWFYGWILRSARCIPFERNDRESILLMIRKALGYLKANEALHIFPEGHLDDGEKLRLPRPGVALLALESGAPIMPLGLRGTRKAFPLNAKPKLTRSVSIHVGELIDTVQMSKDYHNSAHEQRQEIIQELLYQIMSQISELSGMPLHRRMQRKV